MILSYLIFFIPSNTLFGVWSPMWPRPDRTLPGHAAQQRRSSHAETWQCDLESWHLCADPCPCGVALDGLMMVDFDGLMMAL
jgi:hypothetical protein